MLRARRGVHVVVGGAVGGEDGRITGRDLPSQLAVERPADDGGAGRCSSVGHQAVDELDQLLGQPDGDLSAHSPNGSSRDAVWYREGILLDIDGGVAIVTLNAPDRRNALTPGMADELIATFDEVDGRTKVGALAIRARRQIVLRRW